MIRSRDRGVVFFLFESNLERDEMALNVGYGLLKVKYFHTFGIIVASLYYSLPNRELKEESVW